MAYNHGIRIQENPTSVGAPIKSESGVPVVFGTAPVNMATSPVVNKPVLCNTFAEAQAALGYSDDYANYTLCQAMDTFFKVFGVAPVVFVNVLDPAKHKEAYTEELTVTAGQAQTTEKGVILDGLTVNGGSTALVAGTDYTTEFNADGTLVITVLKDGVTALSLSGNKIDPTAVKAADVIGSVDAATGVETGMELVRQVYPTYSLVPNLLLAPGWTSAPEVGIALAAKCQNINGVFSCECVVDLDTKTVKKYTDVAQAKTNAGYDIFKHMICLWPKVKFAGKIFDYSAFYAAMVLYTDANNDSVPNLSPSNKPLGVAATVLADGTEVVLDVIQANVLNAAGVVTAVNVNGFKAWGNNTAAYPAVIDPKDRWICCRRFFSWWGNSFITTYFNKVDDPANYRLIESIVDSENVRGNSLVSQGKCAGIRMVYSQDDNPIENVVDGRIVFRQYLAPYTPAEDILNILEFDVSMIQAALGGE